MATLKEVFEIEKDIGYFPGWSKPEEESHYCWFDAPIEIGGVAETGLVLHGGCIANRPNVHLTFELRFSGQPGRRCRPIDRLDWRSVQGGHSNKRRKCIRVAGARVEDTHLHDFYLNWNADLEQLPSDGLPCARSLEENLQDFESVRAFIGKRLKINNIGVVDEPPWVYDFFSGEMTYG